MIIIVLLLFAMTGFHRGWKVSALHFGSTYFSLWVAAQFYQPLSHYFRLFIPYPRTVAFDTQFAMNIEHPEMRFNDVIVFLLLVLIVKTMLYFAIGSFNGVFALQRLGWSSRIVGACFACCSGIIFIHFACYVTALYPNEMIQYALAQSHVAQWWITDIPFLSEFTLNLK
ncbi:CvpA family protein [Staphylococcus intermedius]|uniref:CvpA family protein n=1 Tax=Staphylococcus intermedius TaxID=1285 RepID=UPI001F4EE11C|nr:CvpA family protein [Staphylococcus intermedius]